MKGADRDFCQIKLFTGHVLKKHAFFPVTDIIHLRPPVIESDSCSGYSRCR
jgi:hypothetical protein